MHFLIVLPSGLSLPVDIYGIFFHGWKTPTCVQLLFKVTSCFQIQVWLFYEMIKAFDRKNEAIFLHEKLPVLAKVSFSCNRVSAVWLKVSRSIVATFLLKWNKMKKKDTISKKRNHSLGSHTFVVFFLFSISWSRVHFIANGNLGHLSFETCFIVRIVAICCGKIAQLILKNGLFL